MKTLILWLTTTEHSLERVNEGMCIGGETEQECGRVNRVISKQVKGGRHYVFWRSNGRCW